MTRFCFVLCYLGPLPRYFATWLATCERNVDVDFLIASDQPAPEGLGPNIRWLPTRLDALRLRFSRALGFEAALGSGYKLCDYKPVLGHAFEAELAGYTFWGFCDPDLVWGHIRSFATEDRLAAHDILSFRGRDFISGPATLLRNDSHLTRLYAEVPGYQALFEHPYTTAFTETCGRWKQRPAVADLVAAGERVSFSDIVRERAAAGVLRWLDADEILEWAPPRRTFRLRWRDGHLFDEKTGREVLMYHYVNAKKRPFFFIPERRILPDTFSITQEGAFVPDPDDRVRQAAFHAQRLASGIPRQTRLWRRRIRRRLQRTCAAPTPSPMLPR